MAIKFVDETVGSRSVSRKSPPTPYEGLIGLAPATLYTWFSRCSRCSRWQEVEMSEGGVRDMRGEALAYLEQHKLLRLFNILGAKLACEKPEDPNAFLLSELSKAAVMNARGQPVR